MTVKVEFREALSLSVAVSLNLPFSLSDVCFLEEVVEVEVHLVVAEMEQVFCRVLAAEAVL